MVDIPPLTEQTIKRLRTYAKGNGLAPESIALVKTRENVYTVDGQLNLSPSFNVENAAYFGRVKEKNKKILPNIVALQEEVSRIQQEFLKGQNWVNVALEEIKDEPGHGWGYEEAVVAWPEREEILAATEKCPICNGAGKSTCIHCRGIGWTTCIHCQGRGQEYCPHCQGTGEEPGKPGERCTTCNGHCFINCRFCQATGKEPCPHCKGTGNIPCPDCGGTGATTRESKIIKGIRVQFTLGRTTDLPSGLLRMMQRVGEGNLGKGHIDVEILPQPKDPETPQEMTTIRLKAKVPYAEMRIRFADKEGILYAFGKQGRLSNVPPFLDMSLAPTRKKLAQAASGIGSLEDVSRTRLIQEALTLVLKGQAHPNHLRHLYPVGLSGKAAQEIMFNIAQALKRFTQKSRAMMGLFLFFFNSALFLVYFTYSPIRTFFGSLDSRVDAIVKVLLPTFSLLLAWLALLHSTKWALKRKYPRAQIKATQPIGKIGYGALAIILLIYIILAFTSTSGRF